MTRPLRSVLRRSVLRRSVLRRSVLRRSVLRRSVLRRAACATLLLCLVGGLRAAPAQTPPAPAPNAQAHRARAAELAAKYDYAGGIGEMEQAYAEDTAGHRPEAVKDLDEIGLLNNRLSRYDTALSDFQQALALAQQSGQTAAKAVILNDIGLADTYLSRYGDALDSYRQALPLLKQAGDAGGQANTLNNIGAVYIYQSRYPEALGCYRRALPLFRQAGDKYGEAAALGNAGEAYSHLNQYAPALASDQQALALRRQWGDLNGEATLLGNIGGIYRALSRESQALACYRQALPLLQKTGDRDGEAIMRLNIGGGNSRLQQPADALDNYTQALAIFRQIGDKVGEAHTLKAIGGVYHSLSQNPRALDYDAQALLLFRQIGSKDGEAQTLTETGNALESLSRFADALDSYGQALTIFQATGDRDGEASTLSVIGAAYNDLGQYAKALDFYGRALPILTKIGDREAEAPTLGNIGGAYDHLGQHGKALDYYSRALALLRRIGDTGGVAAALNNIGNVNNAMGRHAQALNFYRQALPLRRQAGDRDGEAATLGNIGLASMDLRDFAGASDSFALALPLSRQLGDKPGEARTLANLMSLWIAQRRPRLAIFYGKEAVNVLQSIRRGSGGIGPDSRKAYLAANENTYRLLASLLLLQGRLPEAQQVLKMLKEREFYDFLHPDPAGPLPPTDTLSRTPREAEWDARPQAGWRQVAQDFSGPATAADAAPRTVGTGELGRALPPGTAAVYTIVAPDELLLIFVTRAGRQIKEVPITAEALYRKVYALRQALVNPDADPTPLAADLYRLVLGPVQKDLDAARTQTILFSLDDALRYVPPAALYDPERKQYIAERYQTALITFAAAPPAARAARTPAILGLGVSLPQDGASALPGVQDELMALVHEPNDPGGLVPGKRLLDGQFTEMSLEAGLKTGGYPFVHVASHFSLQGDEDTSYLLLGDGSHLSVATLAQDPHRFAGVELLTLSACQTAMEVKRSSGREVEGIATLAQSLGAKAVLASLWPVSDAATPALMTALYGYRQAHPSSPLPEALQAAQLSLLHKPLPVSLDKANRGTEAVPGEGEGASLPSFVFDPKAPYAHPFYWAPFVLIGNWR